MELTPGGVSLSVSRGDVSGVTAGSRSWRAAARVSPRAVCVATLENFRPTATRHGVHHARGHKSKTKKM